MDIIFASIKKTAEHGSPMTDTLGYVRNCVTPLVAYITDLPEQQLITGVTKNASPVTTATLPQFGNPFLPKWHKYIAADLATMCHHSSLGPCHLPEEGQGNETARSSYTV